MSAPETKLAPADTSSAATSTVEKKYPFCEYVLLAEFDIDKGSVLRHQYPQPTGYKESFLAEAMLPEGAHLREMDYTVTILPAANDQGYLCCLNLVRTKMDSTVRRGAVVKAIAICTPCRYYHIFKPALHLALDKYYETPSVDVLARLHEVINSMDVSSIPQWTPLERRLFRASRARQQDAQDTLTALKWDSTSLSVRVPWHLDDDEVLEASVTNLYAKFGEHVAKIHTAVLCEKRVLFLGYQQPAKDVCGYVMATCLLVSPPISGTIKRAFPYANLTNMDFLSVPGYIAGVTNPIFESRKDWWDILCNVATADVTISPHYQEELDMIATDKTAILDQAFLTEIAAGIKFRYGEEWIRSMFTELTQHIVSMALDEEQHADTATRNLHLEAYQFRINQLLRAKQCQQLRQERKALSQSSAFAEMDPVIRHHVRTLQVRKPSSVEVTAIFNDLLSNISTKEHIMELLALMPESRGGMYPIALQLFSKHFKVRRAAAILLQRIDKLEEGSRAVSSLNYFILMTYYRLVRSGITATAAQTLPQTVQTQSSAGAAASTLAPEAKSVSSGEPHLAPPAIASLPSSDAEGPLSEEDELAAAAATASVSRAGTPQ